MILVVTNALDVTADFFEARLRDASVPHMRLNTEEIATLPLTFHVGGGDTRVSRGGAAGYFGVTGARVAYDDVTAVYYRRPISPTLPHGTPPGLAAWMESELRRAWGGVLAARPDVRWVNDPLAISRASYKPEQLARATRCGLRVPETLITTDASTAAAFCDRLDWNVIVKPIGHGEVLADDEADDRVVYTNRLTRSARDHLHRVTDCPTLFQRAIAKDVDLRVTVAGREIVTVALHSQERDVSAIDCRRANMAGMRYSLETLPSDVADQIHSLVESYGLLYAAIDLVRDADGRHWFLELNPAGQWAWLEQVAGAPISLAIMRALGGRP